jgi:hypothetical protein
MKSICFILLVSFLILVDAKSIHQQNFLEMGDYQGDILLAPWQINGRSGIISPNARWPNNTIPFTFGEEYCKNFHGGLLLNIDHFILQLSQRERL